MTTERETENILRLPEPARRKVYALQAQAEASFSVARDRTHRATEIRSEIAKTEAWLTQALRGPNRHSESDGAVTTARGKIDLWKNELAEIGSAGAAAGELHDSVTRLAQRVREAIAVPRDKTFRLSDRQPAVLKKGEDAASAVRRIRAKIDELRATAAQIETSPYPSSFAKEQASAQIERLAIEGRPDVDQAIQNGGLIEFAKGVHSLAGQPGSAGYIETPNAMASLCWLLKDKLTEEVYAEIDRNADDANALAPDERKSLLAKIAAQIEALEYDEVAFIDLAKRDGLTIDHRADVSVFALLSLDPRPVAVPAKTAAPYVSQAGRTPHPAAPVHLSSMASPVLRNPVA